MIEYTYDATGIKLSKTVIAGGIETITTDYLNGYQYVDGKLEFYPHAEGYAKIKEDNTLQYVYNYTDHLGNVRLSYTKGSDGKAQVVEESNYYPFGLRHKGYNNNSNTLTDKYKYGYNGKEEQDELGLNWNDYGARNYDPALGRWMNMDPLAEKFASMSPYCAMGNNPIFYIDPDGREIVPGSQAEWNRQTQAVTAERDRLQGRIDALNTRAAEKGWSAERLANRIGNMQDRVDGLNGAIANFGVLEASTQAYSLNSGAAQNEVSYDAANGNIVISYTGTALFTHETTHAGQFESGDIAFNSTDGATLAQDVHDEVAGYKAQWAYDPSSVGGLNSVNQITPTWVQGITDPATGNQPYRQGGTANAGIAPVNVNSTRDDLIRAYPHQRSVLQTLPPNATLRSIIPTIYAR